MKDSELVEMTRQIREFCDQRDWRQFHSAKDLAIGVSTEANELLELFRFKSENDVETLLKENRDAVGDELADVFYYLLRFADLNDFDLVTELKRKMDQNEKKYPVEKAKGKNLKYTAYDHD